MNKRQRPILQGPNIIINEHGTGAENRCYA